MKSLLNQFLPLICILLITVSCADKSKKESRIKPGSKKQPTVTKAPKKDIIIDPDKVYSAAELTKQAEFPGGIEHLQQCTTLSFIIPEVTQDTKVKIVVSFVVEIDGRITNFKLVEDPGNGFGEEAIRMLKFFKNRWRPGEINKKPVRSSYTYSIPLNIKV